MELMTITRLHQLAIEFKFIDPAETPPVVPAEIAIQESRLPPPDVGDELAWLSVEAWQRGNEPLLKFARYAQDLYRRCERYEGALLKAYDILEPYIEHDCAELEKVDFVKIKKAGEVREVATRMQARFEATCTSLGHVGNLFEEVLVNAARKGKRNG